MNDFLAFLLGAAASGGTVYGLLRRRRRPVSAEPDGDDPGLAERRRTEAIFERMTEGVFVLDERLRPVFANSAARALLGLPEGSLPARLPSEELATLAWRSLREGSSSEHVVELWFPARRSLRCHLAPLEEGLGVVLVVGDVTQELQVQRMRREFVAHASHELKSPVAGLHVLAEAVREAVTDDPDAAASFATRMVDEADRLGRLIADLLDLSRLEEAEDVPRTPVDLSDAVAAEARAAAFAAERKGTALETDVRPGIWVAGERTQLGNLVRNLLDNAIRYTPDGGTILVTLRRDGNDAVLAVADDGIGIPLDAQGRVFERFYRVDKARTRDTGGTGLGLAIVKHVAELHGGSVSVDSELGRGSTFETRLPAITPALDNVRWLAG